MNVKDKKAATEFNPWLLMEEVQKYGSLYNMFLKNFKNKCLKVDCLQKKVKNSPCRFKKKTNKLVV